VYRAIAANKRNTVFIIALFVIIIGLLGLFADFYFGGGYTIFIGTLIGTTVYTLVQYFAAGSQALAMSGAHPIAITEGLPMPRVYLIDDPAPNAFATGRDPKHASVAATTGLLELMDDRELAGVMAHEIGHVKNYDIRVSTIVFGLVVAVGFIADLLFRMAFWGGSRNGNGNPIMLVLGLAAMIIAPLVAAVVQAAVSRQREYLADATGVLTTRDPEALASALQKLGDFARPMKRQNSTMAHLYISDPMKPGIVDRMFQTHPPIADRVKRIIENSNRF
jgi:heat shock protein HtpX